MSKEKNKQKGRQPMTNEEKEQHRIFFANEKPTERTKRVLNPRVKRILAQWDLLNKAIRSPRYVFTEEQKSKLMSSFSKRITEMETSLTGVTEQKKEIEDVL